MSVIPNITELVSADAINIEKRGCLKIKHLACVFLNLWTKELLHSTNNTTR